MGVSLQTIDGTSNHKPADQTAREKKVRGATCNSGGITCGYDISHVRLEIFKLNKPPCMFFLNNKPWIVFFEPVFFEPSTLDVFWPA